MRPEHTDREYEAELRQLRQNLLLMAGRVESMIANSVEALIEREPELAEQVMEEDRRVDQAEIDSDELCLLILAKRQPVASDLRFITLSLKMVTDLERIGDLAVNIGERVSDLCEAPEFFRSTDIQRMGELAQSMVRDAIDSFVDADVAKARDVIGRDRAVNELYHKVFREVLELMVRDTTVVERGIHIQSVAKWLERMGDHAKNLAEHVIFQVQGEDIRHAGGSSGS